MIGIETMRCGWRQPRAAIKVMDWTCCGGGLRDATTSGAKSDRPRCQAAAEWSVPTWYNQMPVPPVKAEAKLIKALAARIRT